jgi:APA family basic amino acid/polyamine antiporter
MRLSLDGPLPPGELQSAHAALKRAKEVGEQYKQVEVATAVVRARRVGLGIVQEARRRGVEAIVLTAESSDGKPGAERNSKFVGDVASYVMEKAPCPVILTASATDGDQRADG